MAARGNLVVNDRTTPTPVAHTFTPDGDDTNGVHVYSEKTGVAAGNPRFTVGLRQSNGKFRPSARLAVPIVQTQTINGVSSPTVVRVAHVNFDCVFDGLSSPQERADAIGQMVNALATSQTQINDLFVNLSDIY